MSTMGYGYGSECHLLRWMGRHRSAFDFAMRAVLGEGDEPLHWLDMAFDARKDWPDAELKGLDFLPVQTLQEQWAAWWPQRRGIHNWDAVGWWGEQERNRLLLVEAKANLAEISCRCKARPEGGLARITDSLREVAEALGVADISSWLSDHYQLANRLAVAHFLRMRGYDPHLVLVYFVGDKGNASRITPQTPGGWAGPLAAQKSAMGLALPNALSPYVHELFLHVSECSAWSAPDVRAEIRFNAGKRT